MWKWNFVAPKQQLYRLHEKIQRDSGNSMSWLALNNERDTFGFKFDNFL